LTEAGGITIIGRLIRVAKLKDEWLGSVSDPEKITATIKEAKINADLFTFRQSIPETIPKFAYFLEWEPLSVIPITSFDDWKKKQINAGARKAIRKAEKMRVEIKVVDFSDDFVREVVKIYNETPHRQGRRYVHYGKSFQLVKEELLEKIEKCIFIAAYYEKELIGFTKLSFEEKFAIPFGLVSKLQHRDKSAQNAMLAFVVKACADKKVPYILYGNWEEGTLGDFRRNNGCQKMCVPRYYISLNLKGNIFLSLRLHHGIKGIIPKNFVTILNVIRKKIDAKIYRSRASIRIEHSKRSLL